jgi:multiple RNA-binding domain-containing protein 1
VSKKSKGIAFVTFANPSHALAAFRSSDGHTFQGRLLHVLPAIQQGPEAEGKTLKDKRRQALKADATKDFKWSTLYMSADAVAASVADRLGIDKTDILNPHDEENGKSISPAVRLALAETSVINETRDFLKEEGINVDAFDETNGQSTKRSDTVLLVKNIPYGTAADTIQSMFEKHGSVERIVMPPGGTIAVVEMQVAGEAKVAFKALSYKRLGNSVLYLEKAPLGLLAEKIESTKKKAEVADAKSSSATEIAPESSTKVETGATLFIKNLSFSTTDERLQLAFSKFADLLFVRIQKRESRKRDGTGSVSLSMGYGFAGFRTLQAAQIAQKAMDKTTLDGHVLSVAFSRRGHDNDETRELAEDPNGAEVAPSSKLIVKNLAFEATKKEVRELFAAYGKLKSVRVPRKGLASAGGAASGVRGFGFVEFVSRSEAMYAYKALRHSHLLGRHLVLEWDVEGGVSSSTSTARTSGVDAGNDPFLTRLRQKAAQNVAASSAAAAGTGAHRRDKLKLNDEDIRQAARDERRSQQNNDDEDDDDEE